MKMTKNTILITGGTSGIGLEFAAQFLKLDNRVIITGRDQRRLEEVQRRLPEIHVFQSDVSDSRAISDLFNAVISKFPSLNVLINNAGIMHKIDLQSAGHDTQEIVREIDTNLTGPVRMITKFLPHLKIQENAAIVNVSSALAFVPFPIAPIYCAAKAGLHSFTQSLRVQLRRTQVKVFELAPPATRTPLITEDFHAEETMGGPLMDAARLVALAITAIGKDQLEIRPGRSNILKLMSRVAPQFILNQLSKPVAAMLEQSTPG